VYKLDSFVGFIGDEQVQAQECYGGVEGGTSNCGLLTMRVCKIYLIFNIKYCIATTESWKTGIEIKMKFNIIFFKDLVNILARA
jgi:hypothetical protein